MILLTFLTLGAWVLVSLPFYRLGYKGIHSSHLDEPRTESNWNAIALFMNIREGKIKPPKFERKLPIDKEIAEEEKEIAELERQKEKIDQLAELKRRKEILFEEVHGKESWECTACGDEFETLRDYGKHISEAHHS